MSEFCFVLFQFLISISLETPRELHFTVFDCTACFESQKQDIKMSFTAACCFYGSAYPV